jgi:tetratricopeptide (TPR) repeat protein
LSVRTRGTGIRWAWLLLLPTLACETAQRPSVVDSVEAALIGEESVPAVHVYENHSSALIAWRRAGVRGRILVHLDGHIDYDWLPDETVARIAAASPDELRELEHHPYAMDGEAYSRFGIWNFIYPAARLGIVRELVWVVPDGSLQDAFSVSQLARFQLLDKLQKVKVREAAGLRRDGRVLHGTLLGLPVTICELSDLPDLPEPVLLDFDLDYFTTRSAVTQGVTRGPWTTPEAVIEELHNRGVRTDLVTISLSTIGGFMPPAARWLAPTLRAALRPGGGAGRDVEPGGGLPTPRPGEDPARNVEAYRRWTRERPDDATGWFLLYRALRAVGRHDEATRARAEAVRLDPLLEHEALFEGDRLWRNQRHEAALAYYESYLAHVSSSPFRAYALRRKAGCLRKLGYDELAIRTYWEVLELAPNHADTHKDLGLVLRARGRVHDALEELQLARRILPARADYAMAAGTTCLLLDRVEEGIAHLEDAVALRPCWSEARRNLAVALLSAGRYEEAAGHVRVALAIQPATPRLRQVAAELDRQGVEIGGANIKSISFE